MNREIKFRAWNSDYKEMWSWKDVKRSTQFRLLEEGVNVVFLQYTGLKDKNGKEIYEGDIVQFTVKKFGRDGIEETIKNGLVYYSDEMTLSVNGWILARIKSREVIGNIYEHPRLLEGEA
jgi:hypothetical protein